MQKITLLKNRLKSFIEHWKTNHLVGGSIPLGGSTQDGLEIVV